MTYKFETSVSAGDFKEVSVKRVNEQGQVHRYVLWPDADLSNEDEGVRAICEAVWTDQVRANYKAHKDAEAAKLAESNKPTAEHIVFERQRRIRLIAGDVDQELAHSRFFVEMLEKGADNQTEEEKAKVSRIRAGNEKIKEIVAKADALLALPEVPDDYAEDKHWS